LRKERERTSSDRDLPTERDSRVSERVDGLVVAKDQDDVVNLRRRKTGFRFLR
jgi:hypothetical protein